MYMQLTNKRKIMKNIFKRTKNIDKYVKKTLMKLKEFQENVKK